MATSDWHLARGSWASRRDISGDSYHSLRQIVDFAIANGVPILAAGDLFDQDDPDPYSVSVLCREADRLEASHVPLYFIQGQHERHPRGPWLGVHPWPTHIHRRAVESPAGPIYGLDWVPGALLQDELDAIPLEFLADGSGRLLALHQVWNEYLTFEGRSEGHLADIPGRATIVTGDHHGGDASLRSMRAGEHLVLSPGPICVMSVEEDPYKSFWVASEGADGGIRWDREAIGTRRVLHFRLYAEDAYRMFEADLVVALAALESDPAQASLPEELRKPIVACWFYEDQADVPAIVEKFKEAAHFFPKSSSRDRKRREADKSALRPAGPRGLLEALAGMVADGRVPDADRPALERLLSAPEPGAVLAELKSEFFKKG